MVKEDLEVHIMYIIIIRGCLMRLIKGVKKISSFSF